MTLLNTSYFAHNFHSKKTEAKETVGSKKQNKKTPQAAGQKLEDSKHEGRNHPAHLLPTELAQL